MKYFGIAKSINNGSQGSNNPEIMECVGFGPSHNKTEIVWDQNEAEKFPGAFQLII